MPTKRAATRARKDPEQRLKQAQRGAALLKHASERSRAQIILTLTGGECHVGSLCEVLNQSQPAVSHHLALLRYGGIVTTRRSGKLVFYSLTDIGQSLATLVEALG
jgi:DNA-binding transcriptional ArsR family regulator